MQEEYIDHRQKLIYWIVVTDKHEHELSEKELDILMESDKQGVRFVRFDDFVINLAFIKEIYKKTQYLEDTDYVADKVKKFISLDNKKLLNNEKSI